MLSHDNVTLHVSTMFKTVELVLQYQGLLDHPLG